jgi:hypothetical protein
MHFDRKLTLPLGQEQSKQSSPLFTVRDGYHHQPRRFRRRPHKPHEDDRDLFTMVLTQHFCPCIYCLESIMLCSFHFFMYYIAQQYNKVERENCYDTSDSAVVGRTTGDYL